ncbi:MAG TPA: hypothetical protein VGQ36_16640 [Thermoanaerobaculia bacterium]|jgi:hypothetical protein|nr:hypothetical protein [Thermoanaerobaculia bacterium]
MNTIQRVIGSLALCSLVMVAGRTSAQTVNATNVSAGNFGANTGGGTYTFPLWVGVGSTSAPTSKLNVIGDLTAAGFNAGNVVQLELSGSTNPGRELLAGFETENSYGFLQTLNRGVAWGPYALALQPMGGQVGIGTSTPAAKLHVNGDIYASSRISGRAGYSTYTSDGIWSSSAVPSRVIMPMDQELRFGYSDAGAGQYYPSIGFAVNSTAVNHSLLILQSRVALGVPESYNRFQVSGGGTLGWGAGSSAVDATLYRDSASTLRTNASLVVDGNVGLGAAASPSYRLYVSGNTHVNGTVTGTIIRAHYQDVAEWVPASVEMAPGTVVVLDPSTPNQVMPSHRAYDTAVAGVVSEQPGLILGVEGDDKEQVATTGRVKVHADATRAPIRIGDLLVSGDRPGTAMRSEPMEMNGRAFHQPGTIIGKALEALPEGEGEILVLLSLQ